MSTSFQVMQTADFEINLPMFEYNYITVILAKKTMGNPTAREISFESWPFWLIIVFKDAILYAEYLNI